LLVVTQVRSCACGKLLVALQRQHCALRTRDLGQDRRVVAEPATDLYDTRAFGDVEDVDEMRPQARQPGIEPAARVDRNQYIVIETDRIRACRQPVGPSAALSDAPGAGPKEALARNGGERPQQRRGRNAFALLYRFRIAPSRGVKVSHA